MKRYYMGVDWGEIHMVWVNDDQGKKVAQMKVPQTVEGMGDLGRWLYERKAEDIEIWASIEKPEGRVVDFLLDHDVIVYPINPKTVDRARDRFRMSQSKSDAFDALVLAEFLRTDHAHLKALSPNSAQAQELKILTRDYQRLVRQQTRVQNQLIATLKEYYPLPLEVFKDLCAPLTLDFLKEYPSPESFAKLNRRSWNRFARIHKLGDKRNETLWQALHQEQLSVPAHVVRGKARLVVVLAKELAVLSKAIDEYSTEVESFFASMPAAELVRSLPGGKSGVTLPTLWAELGDAPDRWVSFKHVQAQAGMVPATKDSGKSHAVQFRFSCNKQMRYAAYWLAFISLRQSAWANTYYHAQRTRGHSHQRALRALGAKWLKIMFVVRRDDKPYDENYHLASMARQQLINEA